jgi:hypothetical protein
VPQKHYDNLSYAFISGAFIAFSYPYVSAFKAPTSLMFTLSAVLVAALLAMYWRAALWARTARRIMQNIEAQFGFPGFALNSRRQNLSEQLSCLLRLPRFSSKLIADLNYLTLVSCLVGAMAVIQIVSAIVHIFA